VFETTELFQCERCRRLLCEGTGPNEVVRYQGNPETTNPETLTWVCGECYRLALVQQ
jgi:RNase P subunit RPR2